MQECPKTTSFGSTAFGENDECEASAEECPKATSLGSTASVKAYEQADLVTADASGRKASAECLKPLSWKSQLLQRTVSMKLVQRSA